MRPTERSRSTRPPPKDSVVDRPLVAHFCGNDPEILLQAATLAAKTGTIDAVDLNLGCPQRVAHAGKFGSYLLGEGADRLLLKNIVACLRKGLASYNIPVFCKIRLLEDMEKTFELVKDLVASGCALVAVHARPRGTPERRREGPANLEWVKRLVERAGESDYCYMGADGEAGEDSTSSTSINTTADDSTSFTSSSKIITVPLVANGNIRTAEDATRNRAFTGASGVMSAEGLLDDPAMFFNYAVNSSAITKSSQLVLSAGTTIKEEGTEEASVNSISSEASVKICEKKIYENHSQAREEVAGGDASGGATKSAVW